MTPNVLKRNQTMKYTLLLVVALIIGCSDRDAKVGESNRESAAISGPFPAQLTATVSGEFHVDDEPPFEPN